MALSRGRGRAGTTREKHGRSPTTDGVAARLAERLLGMRAHREVIAPDPNQSVRWIEHSYPNQLAGWNYHPEYEIHLIRKGTGNFIVGNHIGTFEAGHVSLVGSGLPHDWVSDLEPGEVLENRDAVIQFDGKWVEQTAFLVPEMAEVKPLLEQSARGIEFLGPTAETAAAAIEAMGATTGLERLQHLFELFGILARAPQEERRYLAEEWFRPQVNGEAAAVVDIVLEYVFSNHAGSVKMSEAAALVGMPEPTFSKYFSVHLLSTAAEGLLSVVNSLQHQYSTFKQWRVVQALNGRGMCRLPR